MAVREFNGSTDRLTLGGNGSTLANSARTMMALVKPLTLAGTEAFMSCTDNTGGTSSLMAVADIGGGSQRLYSSYAFDINEATGLTAGVWQIIAVNVDAPSGDNGRNHRKTLGSGSWTHGSAGNASHDATLTWDITEIGTYENGSPKDMRIAWAAVWNSQVSNANMDLIEATPTTANLLAVSTPTRMWEFTQSSVATPVQNILTSTDDQSAITGTTVVVGDDPAWTFQTGGAAAATPTMVASFAPIPFIR